MASRCIQCWCSNYIYKKYAVLIRQPWPIGKCSWYHAITRCFYGLCCRWGLGFIALKANHYDIRITSNYVTQWDAMPAAEWYQRGRYLLLQMRDDFDVKNSIELMTHCVLFPITTIFIKMSLKFLLKCVCPYISPTRCFPWRRCKPMGIWF